VAISVSRSNTSSRAAGGAVPSIARYPDLETLPFSGAWMWIEDAFLADAGALARALARASATAIKVDALDGIPIKPRF